MKISILFIFFLSSFSNKHNSKTIRCIRILHIPNNCTATGHLSFLVWGSVRATIGKLQPRNSYLLFPKMLCVLSRRPLELLFNYSGRDMYSEATPRSLNACNCEVSRNMIIVFFVYNVLGLEDQFSATEDAVGHLHVRNFWIPSM